MSAGAHVDLLLVAEALSASKLVGKLIDSVTTKTVSRDVLRCERPWRGPLFDLLGGLASRTGTGRTSRLGLVVPVVWVGGGREPEVVIVTDHVDLVLRGPLTGRRPDGGPQVFPSLAGIYQPLRGSTGEGGRIYSEVAVAGVSDSDRLTPFERRQLAQSGCAAVCDCLIDAVVVAAFHGLEVTACGVPQTVTGH